VFTFQARSNYFIPGSGGMSSINDKFTDGKQNVGSEQSLHSFLTVLINSILTKVWFRVEIIRIYLISSPCQKRLLSLGIIKTNNICNTFLFIPLTSLTWMRKTWYWALKQPRFMRMFHSGKFLMQSRMNSLLGLAVYRYFTEVFKDFPSTICISVCRTLALDTERPLVEAQMWGVVANILNKQSW
jgi:hypothetical protein